MPTSWTSRIGLDTGRFCSRAPSFDLIAVVHAVRRLYSLDKLVEIAARLTKPNHRRLRPWHTDEAHGNPLTISVIRIPPRTRRTAPWRTQVMETPDPAEVLMPATTASLPTFAGY